MQQHPNRMGPTPQATNSHPNDGWVGLCNAADCQYNRSQECHAPNIRVIKHDDHADCGTYDPRT
ncbi:MAG: DUF1540 domain-containing protein [Chloroflexota bacterium]